METGLRLHSQGGWERGALGGIWVRMGTHFAPQHCKYAEWLDGTFGIGPRGGEWQMKPELHRCADSSWMVLELRYT